MITVYHDSGARTQRVSSVGGLGVGGSTLIQYYIQQIIEFKRSQDLDNIPSSPFPHPPLFPSKQFIGGRRIIQMNGSLSLILSVFLSFCLSVFLCFCLFVFLSFCCSVFLSFCHLCSIVYLSLLYWAVLGCGLRWSLMVLDGLKSSQCIIVHLNA